MSTSTCNSARLRAWVYAGVILLTPTLAFGQAQNGGQAQNEATARALFEEGRALMKAGDYAHACPKLEAARALYEGAGVLLNLGDCYEHAGRTASAWAIFGEAVAVAQRTHRADDEAEAEARKRSVEGKLTRIRVRVDDAPKDLTITRDGAPLAPGAWGVAAPVDPGPHVFRAEASGRRPWQTTATASAPGATVIVVVPALETAPLVPTTPVPTPAPRTERHYWTGLRVAGTATFGAGVLALGVSGIVGLVAKGRFDAASAESGTARQEDSRAAVGIGNAGTAIAVVGVVLAAVGLVIWIVAPRRSVVVSTGSAMGLGGTF